MHLLLSATLLALTGASLNPAVHGHALARRWVELPVAVTYIPNAAFPFAWPWQHQSNAILRAHKAKDPKTDAVFARAAAANLSALATAAPTFTITNATVTPPTGDKRDFLSYATYWWPDTKCPDTCKWIQKDGVINPDVLQLSQQSDIAAMTVSVRSSVIGNLLESNGTAGYEHAAKQLRAWFITPATRMNPNVNLGQIVRQPKGTKEVGRFEGILSVRQLAFIPSSVALLQDNFPGWTKEDTDGITKWISEYHAWLLAPPFNASGTTAINNHRTYWTCQIVEYERFLGKHDDATKHLTEFFTETLPKQINATGDMPLETNRTRPNHYALFNMDALVYLARFGDQYRPDTKKPYFDGWAAGGGAIKRAMDLIVKNYDMDKVEAGDVSMYARLLNEFLSKYGPKAAGYTEVLGKLGAFTDEPYKTTRLYLPTQSVVAAAGAAPSGVAASYAVSSGTVVHPVEEVVPKSA